MSGQHSLSSDENPKFTAEGRRQDLDGGRSVFLGVDPTGERDGLYMHFVNFAGESTDLRLSYEAMDTLTHLYALHLRDRTKEETFKFNVNVQKGDQP